MPENINDSNLINDDEWLFTLHECSECGNLGSEHKKSMMYDSDLNKYFCDDECRTAWLVWRDEYKRDTQSEER